ncbi:DMT family transporter [Bifidobacterium saguinibicoloris]|uniref:DMT family transporter n=1 Tax=Bifidobacterium saguinibicoloris TaxID=2834433 RepID=UPI001C59C962|nr:DMT family transporter [Bifidobacterium saguinibicoloris]MBW3081615.1 DMT family transporter [Bifidobacterium saguinibicoloris]
MLLATAAGWGGGYTFSSIVTGHVTVQWMMAIRLLFGTAVIGLLAFRRICRMPFARIAIPGLLLAVSYWAAFLVQMTGLTMTAPGRNAFLTATYCVLVPFLVWMLTKRRPAKRNLVAAAVCLVGVGFVSMAEAGAGGGVGGGVGGAGGIGALGGLIDPGDLVSLAGGALFGLNITLTGMLAKQYDAMTLTFYEFGFACVLFAAGGLLFDPLPTRGWFTPEVIGSFVYLVLVSTLMAQIFQNIAFACVPSSQGSLILCLESVFGVLFSVLLTGERVTVPTAVGFVLIFCAILLSEVRLSTLRSLMHRR